MKKLTKLSIPLLAMLIIVVSSTITVFAKGNVSYQVGEQCFVFEPGSEYSVTDLFTDTKGVMPGDVIKQQITVTNDLPDDLSICVYMRSLGSQEGTEKFLSQLQLTVVDGDGIEVFNDTVDKSSEWVHIGTYSSENASDILNVTLTVPISMGNEFQEQIGYVDWQFKAEEIWEENAPMKPEDEKVDGSTSMPSPQTGDNLHFGRYIVLMLLCSMLLLLKGVYAVRHYGKKEVNKKQ